MIGVGVKAASLRTGMPQNYVQTNGQNVLVNSAFAVIDVTTWCA